MPLTAVITGSQGQDGTYLTELLQSRSYAVTGLDVGGSVDILVRQQVESLIQRMQPTVVFHLAAYHESSEGKRESTEADPAATFVQCQAVHAGATLNFLEAIRLHSSGTRFFFASSCHVFGDPATEVQDETTPIAPLSEYAITKAEGMQLCRLYRSRYGIHASNGILYNHESIRRRESFISKKLVMAAVRAQSGAMEKTRVGLLSARADWGFAPDFAEAMLKIVEHPTSDDYIIATGRAHRVADLAEAAFGALGLNYRDFLEEDASLLARKSVVRIGNAGKLKQRTGWEPKTDLQAMIRRMLKEAGARL